MTEATRHNDLALEFTKWFHERGIDPNEAAYIMSISVGGTLAMYARDSKHLDNITQMACTVIRSAAKDTFGKMQEVREELGEPDWPKKKKLN